MNKIILSGNICKDIELKYTASNIAVLMNTIAVRNDYKNKEGKYDSQFINFVAYRNNAEYLNKYAAKGTKILLEGKWNNRKYQKQDGTTVYVNEVLVERIELLTAVKTADTTADNDQKNAVKSGNENQTSAEKSAEELQRTVEDPFASFGEELVLDPDDLPF